MKTLYLDYLTLGETKIDESFQKVMKPDLGVIEINTVGV